MSMGLGHRYWVHLIKYHYGDLESCIEFMKTNKPISSYQWFELVPQVNVKKAQCIEYQCNLVEMDKEDEKDI